MPGVISTLPYSCHPRDKGIVIIETGWQILQVNKSSSMHVLEGGGGGQQVSWFSN